MDILLCLSWISIHACIILAYCSNDAYDVLFKAKDIEERIRQISLVSELGSSIDGIKCVPHSNI